MFRFGYGVAPLNCKLSEFNHENNSQSHHVRVKRVFYAVSAEKETMKYKKKKKLKPKTFEEELDLER